MAWKGKKKTVAILHGSTSTIDTIYINDGARTMWAEIANGTGKALDVFNIDYQPASDASWHTVASAASDYVLAASDLIREYVLSATTNMVVLPKSTAGMLKLKVGGVYAVRFQASSGTDSDTTVDLRWQVR